MREEDRGVKTAKERMKGGQITDQEKGRKERGREKDGQRRRERNRERAWEEH